MTVAGKTPKLANPKSHAVLAALRIECPSCKAEPGRRCHGLNYRIVHYARCTFKDEHASRAAARANRKAPK